MAKLIKGVNDLATVNPELAKEWHPTKNGDLTATDVTTNSNKTAWWIYHHIDETGKHWYFEWPAVIARRNNGNDCPVLSGKMVYPGFNDLTTINPELAKEWHPTKNGDLKPTDVTSSSHKKVWWLYHHINEYGKPWAFEWETEIYSRNHGNGCPVLNGRMAWSGFNDLATINPELAKEWHPTKNGTLKPSDVAVNSNKKAWWIYHYIDKSGKHWDFEWEATIANRNNGRGCPVLNGIMVWLGYNDLLTVNPKLAMEWHPTKNGKLKPTDVTANSGQKVWWLYYYTDEYGKEWAFEWESAIYSRNNGRECPFISGKQVYPGFNDLITVNPELAKEWHPTKNGNLKPSDVAVNSHQKVWWFYHHIDEKGNHWDFEWEATIANRNNGRGCPVLFNQMVWTGYNDLAIVNSELASEWHSPKNGDLKPTKVTTNSNKKVWWKCEFGHEWNASVNNRSNGNNCPVCNESKGEKKIGNLLMDRYIKNTPQYKLENCKSIKSLPFDYAILDSDDNPIILIEYDGEQHYKPVDFAGRGYKWADKIFKYTKHNDKIKTDYCRKHNIPLLRIPYWEYNNIEKILLKKLWRIGLIM